jgi:hypothetical protein
MVEIDPTLYGRSLVSLGHAAESVVRSQRDIASEVGRADLTLCRSDRERAKDGIYLRESMKGFSSFKQRFDPIN